MEEEEDERKGEANCISSQLEKEKEMQDEITRRQGKSNQIV